MQKGIFFSNCLKFIDTAEENPVDGCRQLKPKLKG